MMCEGRLEGPPPMTMAAPAMPPGMDPIYYALSLLRRRRLDECVQHVSQQRAHASGGSAVHGVDEQLWYIQTKALVLQSWFDDVEIEDDGVSNVLLDGEQAVVSTAHRPGTSLQAARMTTKIGTSSNRHVAAPGSRAGGLGTSHGRPISSRYGFARPGTLTRGRGNTGAPPVTGRFARLGTASLVAVPGGPHIDLARLNLQKYAREKPMLAKLLCDYLLYVEHRPKLAVELCLAVVNVQSPDHAGVDGGSDNAKVAPTCGPGLPPMLPPVGPVGRSSATLQVGIPNGQDWWWWSRLGKSYYQLGLLRDAESNFFKAIYASPAGARDSASASGKEPHFHISALLEQGKTYTKLDQPLAAMELYMKALNNCPFDHHVLLCVARLHDSLHEPERAYEYFSQVLQLDSSNVEAIACVAAYYFYEKNQPELSLRFYRRLLQMGVHSVGVWNNIGLCAFFTSQLDLALTCLERALTLSKEDTDVADVWYNIGHVCLGLGDIKYATQAFRLAVGADATHAEAINNLAVLEAQRGDTNGARTLLSAATTCAPELHEGHFNAALIAYHNGELEEARRRAIQALDAFPDHPESLSLLGKIRDQFSAL